MAVRKRIAPKVESDHARRRIAAATSGKPVAPPATDGPNLSDPQVQFEILNPQTLGYTLELPGGDRKIVIPTEFTPHDVYNRRVFDDMQALGKLAMVEMMRFKGDERPGSIDFTWIAANIGYLDVVLAKAVVRDAVRDVVARIAYFADDEAVDEQGNPKPRIRPSAEQVAIGMRPMDVSAVAMMLISRFNTEADKQKKAPTA